MKKLILLGAAFLALQAIPALAEEGKGGGKGDRSQKFFEMQDGNKDGMISEQEFLDVGKKRFGAMDGNKDGNLTKEEAKAHHDAMKAKYKENRAKMKAEKAKEAESTEKPAE